MQFSTTGTRGKEVMKKVLDGSKMLEAERSEDVGMGLKKTTYLRAIVQTDVCQTNKQKQNDVSCVDLK